ncbi:hypothetical protein CLF_105512, partial [Clonorchis sinensis]
SGPSIVIIIDGMTSLLNTDASLPYNHELFESLIVKKIIKHLGKSSEKHHSKEQMDRDSHWRLRFIEQQKICDLLRDQQRCTQDKLKLKDIELQRCMAELAEYKSFRRDMEDTVLHLQQQILKNMRYCMHFTPSKYKALPQDAECANKVGRRSTGAPTRLSVEGRSASSVTVIKPDRCALRTREDCLSLIVGVLEALPTYHDANLVDREYAGNIVLIFEKKKAQVFLDKLKVISSFGTRFASTNVISHSRRFVNVHLHKPSVREDDTGLFSRSQLRFPRDRSHGSIKIIFGITGFLGLFGLPNLASPPDFTVGAHAHLHLTPDGSFVSALVDSATSSDLNLSAESPSHGLLHVNKDYYQITSQSEEDFDSSYDASEYGTPRENRNLWWAVEGFSRTLSVVCCASRKHNQIEEGQCDISTIKLQTSELMEDKLNTTIRKVRFLKTTTECPGSTETLSSVDVDQTDNVPSIYSASQLSIKPRQRESALLKLKLLFTLEIIGSQYCSTTNHKSHAARAAIFRWVQEAGLPNTAATEMRIPCPIVATLTSVKRLSRVQSMSVKLRQGTTLVPVSVMEGPCEHRYCDIKISTDQSTMSKLRFHGYQTQFNGLLAQNLGLLTPSCVGFVRNIRPPHDVDIFSLYGSEASVLNTAVTLSMMIMMRLMMIDAPVLRILFLTAEMSQNK